MAASRRRRPFVISEALLRAYSASARVNQYLVEHLDPGVWRAKPPGGGRTIASLVAHLHNCGLVYLRRAPGGEATPGELWLKRLARSARSDARCCRSWREPWRATGASTGFATTPPLSSRIT
jgi:DinB superfamily